MDRPWLKFYEPSVPANLQYPPVPLHQLLIESTKKYPNQNAILFYGKGMTYRELDEETNRFAQALQKLGVRKGDRVAVMLPNIPQCVIAYYGALKIGAIVVMTNPLYVERELQIQLADSGAETIVALDFFYPRIEKAKQGTALKNIILTSVRDKLPWLLSLLYPIKAKKEGQWIHVEKKPPIYDMMEIMRQAPSSPPDVQVTETDLALLQYTGGTTGIPKGVMLTHKNMVANALQCRHWMPTLEEGNEVFLAVVPFFHVYGMSACMNLSIYLGTTLVLLPRFVTKDVLHAIQKTRSTIFMGVQAMYVAINNFPNVKQYNLSSIKVCISGAGPLHVEVQRQFETLTGGKLVEGYGLSEAAPVTHANPIHGKRKPGSIGLPFPDTEVKVVDIETGTQPLPIGEVGELIVQGPQVMQGYWQKSEETNAVLRNGWLHTGDMAKMDDEGYFFIVDRKKDMIKTRGENVYPREVEEVLFRHPKVKDAVVVGLPDSFSGEKIKAYLILKEGESATAEEVLTFCRTELSKFKVPQEIEFRKELPKTIIGKVLRRVLIDEEMKKLKESK
ncbi:long-chain-fatty-acid--CoA ligase [Candidatus Manganitrophus noduliformans]|uniref:Long-chain fatty acid--CoA ligase n=1 Tax=Candidatus Manganitrophus noduliformans TaxID=2606439 RepID=A0A7X6DSY7_9BACT|nr:long-chain fatty acid--CoA ligase [Candidatus Manganitrophus noduliformans]NKE72468.1 long-chain fatty acid--CoA ligase [Candidatus Manganitrophus noduliformans]